MSATKSGVTADQSRIGLAKKAAEFAGFLLSDKGEFSAETLTGLDQAIQAIHDGFGFKVEVLKPATFAAFLGLENRTMGMFKQLESETDWRTLLDQVEESCFLQEDKFAIARPFLNEMWKGEVAQNPYQPPKDWRYLPVPEAVERFRNLIRSIFGSSVELKAETILKQAHDAKLPQYNEGFLTAVKLTTWARLFGIEGNPLNSTAKGREAYAGVVNSFIPVVGAAYVKAHNQIMSFANWREGALTLKHIVLTPAGRITWQDLEDQNDDDFVTAPGNSGFLFAGYSQRLARMRIGLADNQLPQDCIMTGGTLAIQPERLCKNEHLRLDCPGNAYSPDAGGKFDTCLSWYFDSGVRQLAFDCDHAYAANQKFGSAVVLRP